MADPFTLTALTVGSAVVGSATSLLGGFNQAEGQLAQGQAEFQRNQYLAGVAAINERIAKQNADYERKVGEVEAQAVGLKHGQIIGKQSAEQGASGIDVGSGTAVKVRESQHDVAVQDQRVTRANAARRAYGHEIEAMTQSHSGKLYKAAGANAVKASEYAATGSILGAVSGVAEKWSKASSSGLFGSSGGPSGPNSLGGQLTLGTGW